MNPNEVTYATIELLTRYIKILQKKQEDMYENTEEYILLFRPDTTADFYEEFKQKVNGIIEARDKIYNLIEKLEIEKKRLIDTL